MISFESPLSQRFVKQAHKLNEDDKLTIENITQLITEWRNEKLLTNIKKSKKENEDFFEFSDGSMVNISRFKISRFKKGLCFKVIQITCMAEFFSDKYKNSASPERIEENIDKHRYMIRHIAVDGIESGSKLMIIFNDGSMFLMTENDVEIMEPDEVTRALLNHHPFKNITRTFQDEIPSTVSH